MREPIRDKERLQHILDACNTLTMNIDGINTDDIQNDPIRFYGYVKLVEIIGEATYKLTKEFREIHPEVPWRMMEGMRHVLVHDYYRITPSQLVATIKEDIPELRPLIQQLVKEID